MILNNLLRRTRQAQRALAIWEATLYDWLARYQNSKLDSQELDIALKELQEAGLGSWLGDTDELRALFEK